MEKLITKMKLMLEGSNSSLHVIVLFASFIISFQAFSANYYVSTSGVDNPGNGTPSNPYATLKYALSDISHVAGDFIYIEAGVYSDVDINLTLNDINIVGVPSNTTNPYFIGGGFFMSITGTNVNISNLNIKNYNDEGAIDVIGSSNTDSTFVTFENCAFIENITFVAFDANPHGGAIYVTRGAGNLPAVVTIIDCQFNSNVAEDGIGGGALFVEESRLSVSGSRFMCNNDRLGLTTYEGGAIYLSNSSASIVDCFFMGNKVFNQQGGAIMCADASAKRTVSVNRTVFKGNRGRDGVALFMENNYDLFMTNCLIIENDLSTGFGNGGVITSSGSNNDISIINTTVANNVLISGSDACGIVNDASNTFTVENCIIWGNDAEDLQDNGAGNILVSNSVIDLAGGTGYTNGGGNSNTNPNFVGGGDYTVQAGSVAIGAANAATEPSVDLLSNSRTLQTSGSYEFGAVFLPFEESCAVVLPVELTSFSGTCANQKRTIQWQTASEKNNAYFLLERAGVDLVFQELAVIDGQGTTQEESNYEFIDSDKVLDDIVYYQLSQVDYDGRSEVFPIIAVLNDCKSEGILLANYNSKNHTIRLFHEENPRDIERINIYAVSGQLIFSMSNVSTQKSVDNRIQLDRKPAKGIYIIELTSSTKVLSTKIIIQ